MKTVPISVVIPAYNREHLIGEAIESINAQTLSLDEIILVDNNCTDNTVKIARELGAKVVREKKQGIPAARNRGISVCKNDWIAFLDSDDLWEKEKIDYQWNALKNFPDARIISCDSGKIIEPDKTKLFIEAINKPEISKNKGLIVGELYSYSPDFTANLFEWFFINSSTMIFHREVFDTVGLFDEKFAFCSDWEFLGRALAQFPIVTVKKNLADIRLHDQNLTVDIEGTIPHRMIVAKQMLKTPEKYPPGLGKYLIDYEKRIFLDKGRSLAKQKSKSDILPRND